MPNYRQSGNVRLFTRVFIIATTLLIGACSKYQLTLNERVMYTPAPLFTDFSTADRQLKTCLDQAITDAQVTSAGDLKQLICTHAGLTSLEGLEIFTGLELLHLAHNKLQSAEAIARLPQLQEVSLSDNQLQQIPEILLLEKLTMLDLTENATLNCGDIAQFRERYQGELKAPEQCQ
ncbi:hypothetical protein R50073_11690 [Maricurvus nonylphenolicus]|uniref:hypothetical protein n=1 Tax=Maricurvus nonylphenolicus TaxID=1008307 RepID=UPI0036F2D9FE